MKNVDCFNGVKSVALIVHQNPDVDAFCSAVVFRNFLIKQFKIKRVDIFADYSGRLADNLEQTLGNLKINKPKGKYHTAVIMDCPNLDRVGKFASIYTNAKQKVNIDHHSTNTFKSDLKIVEIVSSTCEIVYKILKSYKYEFTTADLGRIYAGIITDTNNFSVGAITKNSFKIASECVENIDIEAIYKLYFSNNSIRNMQMLAAAIENVVTFSHGQIILTHITKDQAEKCKATPADYIGIINRLATITGSKLVCFSYPYLGKYYVSMRADKGYDVSVIAKEQGGGGHVGAAAFQTEKPLAEIEEYVLQCFMKMLEQKKRTKPKKVF